MDQKCKIGGTIGYWDSHLEFFLVISGLLHYMHYYMTVPEQRGHIVGKSLATVTWLNGV